MLFEIKTNFDIVELGDIFITNDEKNPFWVFNILYV